MLGKFQMLNARVLQVACLMSVLAPSSMFLVACGGADEPKATAAPAPAATTAPDATTAPVATAAPTDAPQPDASPTPAPTYTPAPTLEAVADEVFELKYKSGGPTRQ